MIHALAFCLMMIDPFCLPDCLPDAMPAVSFDPRQPAIDAATPLDVKPQVPGTCVVSDEGSCPNGSCRAPARGRLDESSLSESAPGPARRFQPLRNLFRGRRDRKAHV